MSAISVEHVVKEFRLGRSSSLRQTIADLGSRFQGRQVQHRPPFRALDDVSFEVPHGEVLGIVGHNGAGKSTLLKLMSRISVPTSGRVTVNGHLAPLIEVGAGLMGDLTGRENILLNGTILGMSRAEIRRRMDEIIAFAELERFIDTPLKRYSSGMQIRLGFSVATSVDADILLLDEVLAVGDVAFQRKCYERIDQLIGSRQRTILIVGHNIRQIERMCSRVIMLERGRVLHDGDPAQVCRAFLAGAQARVSQEHLARLQKVSTEVNSGHLDLVDVLVTGTPAEDGSTAMATGEPLSVRMRIHAKETIRDAELVVGIHSPDLLYVTESSSAASRLFPVLHEGENDVECSFLANLLRPGAYGIGLSIYDSKGRCLWRGNNLGPFDVAPTEVAPGAGVRGMVELPTSWRILDQAPDPAPSA